MSLRQGFDRVMGDVNPAAFTYWHDYCDLAHLVEKERAGDGSLLKGRIHLVVETADRFHLDGSAHLFAPWLEALGADAHFSFIPGCSHFNLQKVGQDRFGVYGQFAAKLYAVACPGANWKQWPRASKSLRVQ
ncbi:MAG: hypothetical protein ACP5E5_08010 [Acidobacteriaceae bacterium]